MRVLNFNDGFSSDNEPPLGTISANNILCFSTDEAFVAYKTLPASIGDLYLNTTSQRVRYYNGTSWLEITNTDEFNLAITLLQSQIDSNASDLYSHITNTTDVHDASSISVVPSGNLSSSNAQSALVKLQGDIDTANTAIGTKADTSDLTTHESKTTSVHGITDTSKLLTTDGVQVVTNKDIDGGTASDTSRITIPKGAKTTLDGLTRKQGTIVYDTTSNKPYFDDGSNLKEIGTGSGSGTINFIDNPDGSLGTTGWNEGSYTAATRPSGTFTASSGAGKFAVFSSSTNPLGVGTTSLEFAKYSGASRQGRAVEFPFDLPLDYRAKVLSLDISYMPVEVFGSTSFVAGSRTTDSSLIWYCAFSNDNGSTYTVAEPSSFKCLSNSTTISDRFRAEIQSPYDATNMKLIAYVAETADSAWSVKAIVNVNPSEYVFGSPITDWQSFTPTTQGFGTITSELEWRKNGSNLEIRGAIVSGSATPDEARVYFPNNLVAKTVGTASQTIGAAITNGYNQVYGYVPTVVNGNNYFTFGLQSSTTTAGTNINGDVVGSAGNRIRIPLASIPIQGWSSSVQMSDSTSTTVVDFVAITTPSQALTANVTDVSSSTIRKDSHGAWDTNGYEVPVAGDYVVKLTVQCNVTSFFVYVNGVVDRALFTVPSNGFHTSGTLTIPNLKVGDRITFRSSTSLTLTAGHIGIERISGPSAIAATESINARYRSNSGQVINNAAITVIDYSVEDFDSHGFVTTGASWKFTPSISGVYRVSAKAMFVNSGTWSTGEYTYLMLYKGSSLIETGNVNTAHATFTSYFGPHPLVTTIKLNAGESIAIRIYQSSGASLALVTDSTYNSVSIERVGN